MKATIDAKDLGRVVTTVAPFVAKASGLAALTMIRLEAADGTLTATASDLEHTCTTSAACDVGEPDVIVAPAAFLARAVGVFDGAVEVTADGGELVLEAAGRHVAMRLGDPAMYPRLAWPEGDPTPLGDTWARMLSVLHAASAEQTRPILTGLHLGDGWAEATDSYRAAWTQVPDEFDALIPAEALRRAAKVLGDDVSAWTDDRQFTVTDGTTTIATRLIEGGFPADLRRLVPAGDPFEVTVDSAVLLDALAAVSVVPQDGKRIDPVWVSREGELLHLRVTGPDVGTVEVDVEATFDGTWPERLGFQAALLVGMVKAAAVDTVTIVGVSATKPVTVVGGDIDQLIMTVNPT